MQFSYDAFNKYIYLVIFFLIEIKIDIKKEKKRDMKL